MENSRKQNHKKTRGRLAALLFVCLALFAACRSAGPAGEEASKTRQIEDALGRRITIPERVERVVSLAPSLTENIFAVGAGDRLVGVTTYCNYPEDARKIQKIGDTVSPNMEAIIALRPQIVFVSTASQIENFARTLEERNIAVFVTNPQTMEDVFADLRELGEIFGTLERTTVLLNELQERLLAVDEEARNRAKVRVFVQISKEPLFTIGKDSFLTEMVGRAGGESVTKDVATAYPKLNKETALALDPEVIILSDSEDNRAPNDVFKNSKAVKNNRIYRIDADLVSRPGPRSVAALEQIAEALQR